MLIFIQEDISSNSALKEIIEILGKNWRTLFKISRKIYKILLKYVFVLWELAVIIASATKVDWIVDLDS